MELTFQDFIQICTHFEAQNQAEFDRDRVQMSSFYPQKFFYDATFRDENNYKTFVRIHFYKNKIEWDTGWEDAHDAIFQLFEMLFPDQSNNSNSFIHFIPDNGFIRDLERSFTTL
ncbi:hypothetical protein D3C74_91660 [compost metagenome]